ncbi:hypothetical protein [Runella zeae]|uniref:hypothetical protein n=1 Tax=Runella zeae TaxID=94255 RepID=UPI00235438E9|nr:hypothetical protein [Runella zeae]
MVAIPNSDERAKIVQEAFQEFMSKTGVKNCIAILQFNEKQSVYTDGGILPSQPKELVPMGLMMHVPGGINDHLAMLYFLNMATKERFPLVWGMNVGQILQEVEHLPTPPDTHRG